MAPSVVWSPTYEVDLGPHVFVTAKYRLARELLLADRTVGEDDFVAPIKATRTELSRAHTDEFLSKVETDSLSFGERTQLEVPLTEELREAMALSCGGTLLTARRALGHGVAVHLGGGFHHAYAGHGEGFCLYNDIAVAARARISDRLISSGIRLVFLDELPRLSMTQSARPESR